MNSPATFAAMGVLLVLAIVAFFAGRGAGRKSETARQAASRSTAEETAQRITDEARRESDSLRKDAVLAGKEELIKLREAWEVEARRRREEVEREEKSLRERELALERRADQLEQRDRDLGRRASELGRKEKLVADRQTELDGLVADE